MGRKARCQHDKFQVDLPRVPANNNIPQRTRIKTGTQLPPQKTNYCKPAIYCHLKRYRDRPPPSPPALPPPQHRGNNPKKKTKRLLRGTWQPCAYPCRPFRKGSPERSDPATSPSPSASRASVRKTTEGNGTKKIAREVSQERHQSRIRCSASNACCHGQAKLRCVTE